MNEKLEAAIAEALARAPILRREDLPNADLKGQNLTNVEGLLPEDLSGADLTDAKLPEEIAEFPALGQVAAISSEARKIFIGLLAACVYAWLVIGTTTDVALILNTASSPLPIINTPIPIAGFYVVGAALLAAVYCYFHFYLQRLWRTLATLPAVFPDGTPLDDRTDPWLLTNLVRANFKQLSTSPPPLTRLENLLTILLAWWLVPLTLIALWARYLPAHYWLGTTCLVALIGITALFGRHSYRLAGATLRGEMLSAEAEGDDGRGVSRRAWHEFPQIRPDQLTVSLVAVLIVCSLSGFLHNPRAHYTWLPKGLNAVGVRIYADLREVNVAEPPDGWDGKDWSKVKRVDLRGRNLAFADATGVFLANADLRGATLTGADLEAAQLQGANLSGAQLQGARLRGAELQGANLESANLQGANLGGSFMVEGLTDAAIPWRNAQLQGANLSWAKLRGAYLSGAQLQGAVLTGAELQGADLGSAQLQGANLGGSILTSYRPDAQPQRAIAWGAQLQGANLSWAKLQGADLRGAELQGADLGSAQLQGANLHGAKLQGANLALPQLHWIDLIRKRSRLPERAQRPEPAQLQGADLRGSNIWRAWVSDTQWDLADLRLSTISPMSDSDIDALISNILTAIPDEETRKAEAERLNASLRTEELPARPDFPEEWRSEPNVMFDQNDPRPEPFDWGRPNWATEEAYDQDLATLLGDLACASDVPEAQTRGLARRALTTVDEEPGRLWPVLFAKKVTGADCPPADGLPDDMRREVEELADPGNPAAAAAERLPPDAPE